MKTWLAVVAASLVLAARASAAPPSAAVSRSTAPFEGEDAASAPSTRADYEQRARRELDDLRAQLDAAEKKAATLSDKARRQADERVADLKKRVDQTDKQVAGMEHAGKKRWHVVRKHLDSTLESLRREYDGLRRDLDEQKKRP